MMDILGQARLLDTVRRLIRRGAHTHLDRVIEKTQPADIAGLLPRLSGHDAKFLLKVLALDEARAAEVISFLAPELAGDILPLMEIDALVAVFQEMPPDDAADLLHALPDDLSSHILERMEGEEADDVEELMRYGPKTAGGIMSTEYFSLNRDVSAREAIAALQTADDAEMVFYIYCVNEQGHLVGVLSLRDLLTHPPDTSLRAIMNADVIQVSPDMDQEYVARLVARYDLLALPVCDEFNKLIGIVTVDDIIDVVRDEATEDFLKMAGAGDEEILESSALRAAYLRAPWMALAAFGGIAGATLIAGFEERIREVVLLAAFIPVVIAMGGNVGSQSATIMVRGLATGRVVLRGPWKVLLKELRTGVLLALFGGSLVGLAAFVLGRADLRLGLVVGGAIMCNMIIAALVGSLVPLVFRRLKIDPAVAAGPIMTTLMDILGIVVYFGTAVGVLSL